MRIFKIVILILVLFVALVTSSVLTNAMSLPPVVNTVLTGVIVGFAFLMLVAIETQMQSDQHEDQAQD